MLAGMASLDRIVTLAQLSVRSLWHPAAFGVRVFVEDRGGRVVLIRHSYRSGWFLPGGGVNRREAPEAAAVREAREGKRASSGAHHRIFGLYTQAVGWITNVVSVYRLREASRIPP